MAVRRDYLPTEPVLDVRGEFGDPGDPELRFAVLGDSTSAGVGVDTHAHAYPYLLAERLAGGGRFVVLETFGISGARAEGVRTEQLPRALDFRPDLVFIGIGANDVTHLTPLDEVERDVGATIDELLELGATVVVAGAPDMRADAWFEPLRSLAGWRGRRVAAAVEVAAAERSVTAVPLAKETGPFFEAEPGLAYSSDLFHPGRGGYAKWAEVIHPFLERALGSR